MRTTIVYFLFCVVYQVLGQDDIVCRDHSCCFRNETSHCPVNELPLNEPTYIHPGGTTGCLAVGSSPYRFMVTPGSNKKLVLFFQNGGFCWSKLTSSIFQPCRTEPLLQDNLGIFDRSSEANPFKDWTVVTVLYCSGDAHVGNRTMSYRTLRGKKPIQHFGARNVQSVLDWVRQQNYILDDLLVIGVSAGSVGVQFHSHEILSTFKYDNAAVVLDSFVGVLGNGFESNMFQRQGVCDNTKILQWNPILQDDCLRGELTIPTMLTAQLQAFPNVTFHMVTSKTDITQLIYYGLSVGIIFPSTVKSLFYKRLTDIVDKLATYNNFASYLIEGSAHMFTNTASLFSTFPSGIHGLTSPNGETAESSLVSYLKQLPLKKGSSIPSYCFGEKVSGVRTVKQCSDQQEKEIHRPE